MNTFNIIILLALFYIITSSIQYTLEENKIYILIGEEIFLINLIENSITKELISLLPLKTKFFEEKKEEKFFPLSVEIETENYLSLERFSNKANIGDLFLFKGKKLILFSEQKDLLNNNGDYIKIGSTKQPDEIISSINKNRNKTFLLWNTLNYADHKGKIKPYAYYSSIMNYFTWKALTFFCFLFL